MSTGRATRHPDHPAGHALLRLSGAGGAVSDPRLTIRRVHDTRPVLGPDGWQPGEALLHPEDARAEAGDLLLHLGPEIVEHLEEGTVEVLLPGQNNAEFIVVWPAIPQLRRAGAERVRGIGAGQRGGIGVGLAPPRPAPPPAPTPSAAPPAPPPPAPAQAPTTPPVFPPPPPPARRNAAPLVLIGVILTLLFGALAAAWFFWWRQPVAPPPPPVALAAPPPAAAPPRPACHPADGRDPATLPARDVLALPGCEPAAYTDVAAAMQRAGRHDDALLLLELAAERGHVPAMTALAKLYDPATFRAGQPFSAPDPRQAARLYRDAAQGGDAAAAPLREALRTTLQAAAEGGDQIARLTLQDYWP